MRYEEEMQPTIRTADHPDDLNTRAQMRDFLGTLLAPLLAVVGLGLVTFAPSPSDIALAFKPYGTPLEVVDGGEDVHAPETDMAARIRIALGPTAKANADCFEELRLADEAKLDRCGKLLYQALAEVNDNPAVFTTDVAESPSPKMVAQELKLAATQVCRERWSRDGAIPKDSPVCTIALASAIDPEKE